MKEGFRPPAESPSPVLGGVEVERPPEPAPLLFIGGTGRSGTHVLSRLVGRHDRFGLVPVEVRFHTDPDGFPGLLAGEVTPERFLRRLRGFWWRGFQTNRMRGMYRFVDRERFDAAADRFEATAGEDLEAACRTLFYDLLGFRAEGGGLIEQSTDNVARAATLHRLFPEARFVHVVRDGRDASASRVAQTRRLIHPRTREEGLEWWERRVLAIEAGAAALPADRLLTMSLDELLLMPRARAALRPLFRFLGVTPTKRTRRWFRNRMTREQANAERWRRGISAARAERIEARYAESLARLDAAGARCAPLLRHAFERRDDDRAPLVYVYDRG